MNLSTFAVRLVSTLSVLIVVGRLGNDLSKKVLLAVVLSHYFLGLVYIGRQKLSWIFRASHAWRFAVVICLAVSVTFLPIELRESTVVFHAILTDVYMGKKASAMSGRLQWARFVLNTFGFFAIYRHLIGDQFIPPWAWATALVVASGFLIRTLAKEAGAKEKWNWLFFDLILVIVALLALARPAEPHAFWYIVWYHVIVWFWYPLSDERLTSRGRFHFLLLFIMASVGLFWLFSMFKLSAYASGKVISSLAFVHIFLSIVFSNQQPALITQWVRRYVFPQVKH